MEEEWRISEKIAAIPRVKHKNTRFVNASGFIQHSQLRLKECFCTFGGGLPNATQGTDMAANRSAIHQTAFGKPWLSISLLTATGRKAPPVLPSGTYSLRQKVRYVPTDTGTGRCSSNSDVLVPWQPLCSLALIARYTTSIYPTDLDCAMRAVCKEARHTKPSHEALCK